MISIIWNILAVTVIAILVAACATTATVSTDYRPGTDYSIYKTFSLSEEQVSANPFVEGRIRHAIATQLEGKGLNPVKNNGDLVVVPRARLRVEQQIDVWDTGGWGYRGAWGGVGTTQIDVRDVPIGTLVVDLVDGTEGELVWRGVAESIVDQRATPEQSEERINAAVARLFREFPPAN